MVVTSRPRLVPPEWWTVEPAPTVESAVAAARRTDPLPIVAGGAGVYAAALADVTDLWWTDLDLADLRRNDGDVVMPEPQWDAFEERWTAELSPRARVRYLRRRRPDRPSG